MGWSSQTTHEILVFWVQFAVLFLFDFYLSFNLVRSTCQVWWGISDHFKRRSWTLSKKLLLSLVITLSFTISLPFWAVVHTCNAIQAAKGKSRDHDITVSGLSTYEGWKMTRHYILPLCGSLFFFGGFFCTGALDVVLFDVFNYSIYHVSRTRKLAYRMGLAALFLAILAWVVLAAKLPGSKALVIYTCCLAFSAMLFEGSVTYDYVSRLLSLVDMSNQGQRISRMEHSRLNKDESGAKLVTRPTITNALSLSHSRRFSAYNQADQQLISNITRQTLLAVITIISAMINALCFTLAIFVHNRVLSAYLFLGVYQAAAVLPLCTFLMYPAFSDDLYMKLCKSLHSAIQGFTLRLNFQAEFDEDFLFSDGEEDEPRGYESDGLMQEVSQNGRSLHEAMPSSLSEADLTYMGEPL